MSRKTSNVIVAALLLGLSASSVSHAQVSADYSDRAGDWDIEGLVTGIGNTILCKMQKSGPDDLAFAYVMIISVEDGRISAKSIFTFKTRFPDDSFPTVVLSFDGHMQKPFIADVSAGYLHSDLSGSETGELAHLHDLLRSSTFLMEVATVRGYPDEATMVDLSDSDTAFVKTRGCIKTVLGIALARMQQNSGR